MSFNRDKNWVTGPEGRQPTTDAQVAIPQYTVLLHLASPLSLLTWVPCQQSDATSQILKTAGEFYSHSGTQTLSWAGQVEFLAPYHPGEMKQVSCHRVWGQLYKELPSLTKLHLPRLAPVYHFCLTRVPVSANSWVVMPLLLTWFYFYTLAHSLTLPWVMFLQSSLMLWTLFFPLSYFSQKVGIINSVAAWCVGPGHWWSWITVK